MSEMIERVAIAICKSRTCEGIDCCQWPANRGRIKCPVKLGGYNDAAHDAIAALRHPNKTMIEQGKAATGDGNIFLTDQQIKDCWYAMICAALKETEHA